MNRYIFTVTLLLIPQVASAQIVVSDPTLTTTIQANFITTLQALGLQTESIVAGVESASQTLNAVNKSLALARSVKRGYEYFAGYDLQQFEKDSQAALFTVLPELKTAHREWNMLLEDGKAIDSGQFWNRRTINDFQSDKVLAKYIVHGYRAGVMNLAGVQDPIGEKFVTDGDKILINYFGRSQVLKNRLIAQHALAKNNRQLEDQIRFIEAKASSDECQNRDNVLDALNEDAPPSECPTLDVLLAKNTAVAAAATAAATQDLADIEKSKLIAEEAKKIRDASAKVHDDETNKAMAQSVQGLLKIGAVK